MGSQPPWIVRLARVASTQDEARRLLAQGCRSGTVVVAEEQTEGRGRHGRPWISSPGLGLWLTYIHRSSRPAREWPAVTVIGALGVCLSLESIGLHAETKWPNDVLLSGRKVGGILADAENGAVLLGIGVNVLQGPSDFPEGLRPRATSVRIECARMSEAIAIDRERLLGNLLEKLGALLGRFEREGPEKLLERAWVRSAVRGRVVTLELPSGERCTGRAVGLGPAGELRIERPGGPRPISNGRLVGMEEA